MSLQPSNSRSIDRQTTAPFLLRLFWRQHRQFEPYEFSIAPPQDTSTIPDYSSLLPSNIRQQSVQIYTWPTCTLSELTGLLTSVLPEGMLSDGRGGGSVGTRLVYKLIFPDTRGGISESGRGKWIDKPLGSVVIGGKSAMAQDGDVGMNGDSKDNLEGDADKTLADARFVIGDYVACTIYPPTADGRVAPMPGGFRDGGRPPREPYAAPRGPPLPRENGYGGRGSYRGGYGGGRGGGPPVPAGDWRRGERPPPSGGGYRGGGGGGRPY